MAKVILLNKPYDVLCQFTDQEGRQTLADFVNDPAHKDVYPAGRLDRDSEGLVVLTDDGQLQHKIAHPKQKLAKTYWVQIEGEISDGAITQLEKGVVLKDGLTKPATVKRLSTPDIWTRSNPVRFRKSQPTCWISLTITEGRNRQVRRMTAAVGFPTLRLIRYAVGDWSLNNITSNGELIEIGQYVVKSVDMPPIAYPKKRHKVFKSRK